jgi:pantetheine-phosphate adenylyltransferase
MRIAIYPGSFDPVTIGHLDIIKRAEKLCDKLLIAVAGNIAKKALFTIDERIELLELCCNSINKIEVVTFDGLLADFCRKNNVSCIIKGIRSVADYEYEYDQTLMNRHLAPEVETVYLLTRSEYSFISSSIVKEVAGLGGDVSKLVPQFVIPQLQSKYSRT